MFANILTSFQKNSKNSLCSRIFRGIKKMYGSKCVKSQYLASDKKKVSRYPNNEENRSKGKGDAPGYNKAPLSDTDFSS